MPLLWKDGSTIGPRGGADLKQTHSPRKHHRTRLLAKLPPDGSEQLRALVRACNPLKTLDELSAATRIAPPQLALLGSHLVYWGYARVVRTITLRSVYAVRAFVDNIPTPPIRPAYYHHSPMHLTDHTQQNNPPQIKPTAPTHLGALPALAFQQRFPPHSFFRVLAGFGAGQALGALLEGLSEVRVWLGDVGMDGLGCSLYINVHANHQ